MKKLFLFAAALLAIPAAFAQSSAKSTGWTPYDAQSFERTRAAKRTLVVDVHADWCPTCRAQAPILDELRKDRRLRNVSFVRVDWDDDKDFVRRYRVARQSTILVFRDGKETDRSIAETDRARLRAFVLTAARP